MLSLRTVSLRKKTCQLDAGWRRATDTLIYSGAKPSTPSLCTHTHTCTLICARVHTHTCICVKSYTRTCTHVCAHACPSHYTELSWTAGFLRGVQVDPPLTEAANRTTQALPMGQDSPACSCRQHSRNASFTTPTGLS